MPATYSYDIAVTVTLPPLSRRMTSEEQYEHYIPLYKDLLRKHKHTSVVELTSNYDVHIHCVVSFKDLPKDSNPLMYAKNLFRRKFGFTCVKQCTDINGWAEYLFKDLHKTNDLLKGACLLQDDYELHTNWKVE